MRTGRRDRNMQEKRARIFAAASELFAERGFAAVTTQEISERADVAAGTLFRYAASKPELLLMVYNEELRTALAEGRRRAAACVDLADALVALALPTLERSRDQLENAVVYQRELLFGPPTEHYRAEGLELVLELERGFASLLLEAAGLRAPEAVEQARLASRSMFAVLHLAIASLSTDVHADRDPVDDLRGQFAQISRAFLAAVPSAV